MSALQTSPLNLVPRGPEYRPYKLRCRFTISPRPCHRRISQLVPPCGHVARAMAESGALFFEDMARQGWTPIDGDLFLTGGPFPSVALTTSDPRVPSRPARGPGRHPRSDAGIQSYASPIVPVTTLDTVDGWEYELTAWFIRPMLPTVMTVEAARHIEIQRALRRAERQRGVSGGR